jgi:hypothetical protein
MKKLTELMMTVTIAAISMDTVTTKMGRTEIVTAYCTLTWNEQRKKEEGECHFRQAFGNVQIWMGQRWAFDFPSREQGKSYQRSNEKNRIIFTREGEYKLTMYQDGKPMTN